MLKYLLLITLGIVVWWAWQQRARSRANPSRQENPAERMVTCAHCGVYLPVGDSLGEGDRYYCCEAHRKAEADSSSQ